MRAALALVAVWAAFASTVDAAHGGATAAVQPALLRVAGASGGSGFDYDTWTALTTEYIHTGVLGPNVTEHVVDYVGMAADARFASVVASLAGAAAPATKNETYALFMNAYNVLAINTVIRHACTRSSNGSCAPVKSIRDVGNGSVSVWNMPAGVVAGTEYSLQQIEDFLRDPKPYTEDARLHACIVCASISCPDVRIGAFTPNGIDAQMDDAVAGFLANPGKGALLDESAATLRLSPIFLWYMLDFIAHEGGVKPFVARYLPAPQGKWLASHDVDTSYFDYDWDVNGPVPCKCAARR